VEQVFNHLTMRKIQLNKKKGMSIGDMYPAVLTIVLVGIVLGVGLYVLSTLHTSIATDYSGSQNSINASAGTTTLTDASLTEFALLSIDTATNQTGTAVTNYTSTSAGVITWGADVIVLSATDLINVTYTYNYDATSSAEESITTTITGLATFADWIAIIVVVIAAAIVLGIVLSSFGRKNTI
jgi:hypothetical protein